jgi:hypothetical protein
MSSGIGPTLNLSKDLRALLDFKTLTIHFDKTTPLTYNITIIKNESPVFSKTFVTSGESLPLELVQSNGGGTMVYQTTTMVYGPDFRSIRTYHIQAPFLNDNANYTIRAELQQ